jgi:glycosyltransferase involved in cell wall biosynthesis
VPVISIVTPVQSGRHNFLLDAYQSLTEQQLPDGWLWEWLVQEDGNTGVALRDLPDDPRIKAGVGRTGRAPMARNLALSRATGVVVRALDADDLLTSGALRRDIEALAAHPEISWCVSPGVDLHPDGSLVPGPRDPVPGPLKAGLLVEGYRADLLPVVGGTLAAYSDLVRTLGGWPALPASEDVGLLLACEAISLGWMLKEPSLHYRKWSGQSSAEPSFQDESELAARRDILLTRVDALHRAGWKWSPKAARQSLSIQ